MRKILKWIILATTFIILLYTINGIYQEAKIRKGSANQNLINNIKTSIQNENNESNIEKSTENEETQKNLKLVAEEYKGYTVAANLKIEKLNIDTCVLQNYTNNAMNICVTKFFGPEPNEIGNFCITGHNYITKNMFGYLYKLELGDTFTLTDNKNGTVEYEVYDKYRVEESETYRTITKNKWAKRSYIGYLLQLFY